MVIFVGEGCFLMFVWPTACPCDHSTSMKAKIIRFGAVFSLKEEDVNFGSQTQRVQFSVI